MGINIGTPQIEIALSEIGLFELAGDALKQLELTAISDSLSVLGQSAGFKIALNLPANTQALVSQGISTGIKKDYVLSVETRNLIAQAEGIHFGGNKVLFPEITPVILGLSEIGLTVQRQASLDVQNLSLTVTDVDLVTARVLNAEDTQLVFNEPIVAFRKFSLQASGMSLFIQEQDTNLYKQARLNITNVFIDLGTSSSVLKTARKILPQVNNVDMYSGLVGLVKRSRLITETQELIGSLTESRVNYGRVLLPIKSDLGKTSNESVLLLKRYLNALDSSNHLEVQEALLKYFRTLRLNVYNLNLNDSNTWFMRSDLPEGFFRLVRQLESRQSILPEENRATIMESP